MEESHAGRDGLRCRYQLRNTRREGPMGGPSARWTTGPRGGETARREVGGGRLPRAGLRPAQLRRLERLVRRRKFGERDLGRGSPRLVVTARRAARVYRRQLVGLPAGAVA